MTRNILKTTSGKWDLIQSHQMSQCMRLLKPLGFVAVVEPHHVIKRTLDDGHVRPTYDKISHQLHLIKYSIQLSASFYRNSGTCSTGVQSLKLILPEQFSTNIIFVSLQAKAGFGMNIFCVVVLIICVHVYGVPMFDLNTFPHWAGQHAVKNVTLVCRNETVS